MSQSRRTDWEIQGRPCRMRTVAIASVLVGFSVVATLGAQQPNTPASAERVRLTLQGSPTKPGLIVPPIWTTPDPARIGILTFAVPERNGEVVRIVVPVGDLATRAVCAVANARYRRAEARAHDEVVRASGVSGP